MKALLGFFLLGVAIFASFGEGQITISGRDIMVNGQKFYARGVAYGMTPLGQWPDSKDSAMAWDWISTPAIFNRDMKLLSDLNANVIRVYNLRNSLRHDAFLDACKRAGIYVLLSYPWNWNQYNANDTTSMRNEVVKMVTNHANHSAVLGWCIGNELNWKVGTDAAVWGFVKELKDLVHQTETRIGAPWHPVTSPLSDGKSLWYVVANYSDSCDFFSAQLYKGRTFWDFFTLTKRYATKPMLITEFGVDSYTGQSRSEGEAEQANWNAGLWREIASNFDAVVGGVVYQYSDAYFPCGGGSGLNTQDNCGTASSNYPGGQENKEYYGMMAINNTIKTSDGNDTLRAKPVYYSFKSLWSNYTRAAPLMVQKANFQLVWDPLGSSASSLAFSFAISIALMMI